MKKYLLIISVLLVSATSRAQYANEYYHRVGDTIEWRSEIGYYAWWEFEYYYENNMNLQLFPSPKNPWNLVAGVGDLDSLIWVQKYYTPAPLRVVGLAGGGIRYRSIEYTGDTGDIVLDVGYVDIDTDSYKNYYVIYDAQPDSFLLVGKLEWNPYDAHRTLHVVNHKTPASPGDSTCCKFSPVNRYLPIYEYYFDSAVTVTDSFYVGGTYFGDDFSFDGIQVGIHTAYWSAFSFGPFLVPPCKPTQWGRQFQYQCMIDPWLYKVKYGYSDSNGYVQNRSFAEASWEWYEQGTIHFLIYPLVEVDTTVPPASMCDTVANVQVTPSGTSAMVTWDDFPYYSRIYLHYGQVNVPQSQWTEIDVTGSAPYTLTGLTPTTRYGIQMKAVCDTSKKETPWCEPVYFWSGTDTTGNTEGIDGGTLLSRLTYLQPNPARDEVLVTSSFSLKGIEIWTADGVLVFHERRSGHEATVDVSYLRSGTYIVAIHTHGGTTHKRLVIAR